MPRCSIVFSQLILIVGLVVFNTNLNAEQAIGPGPDVFAVADSAAVAELNALYAGGAIGFAEYKVRLAKLQKSAHIIGGTDVVLHGDTSDPTAPANPASASFGLIPRGSFIGGTRYAGVGRLPIAGYHENYVHIELYGQFDVNVSSPGNLAYSFDRSVILATGNGVMRDTRRNVRVNKQTERQSCSDNATNE